MSSTSATEPTTNPDPFANARRKAKRVIFGLSALLVLGFSLFVGTVNIASPSMAKPLPQAVSDPYRAALRAQREGNRTQAAILLRMVPETHRDYGNAMRMLASLLAKAGRERDAVAYANEAILVQPLRARSWSRLASTYAAAFQAIVQGR